MTVEYYYEAYMLVRESPKTIRLNLAEDDNLIYRLVFQDENECGNYLRLLHHYAIEMRDVNVTMHLQNHLVKEFLEDNPLDYEYILISMD